MKYFLQVFLVLVLVFSGCVENVSSGKSLFKTSKDPKNICMANCENKLKIEAEKLPYSYKSIKIVDIKEFNNTEEAISFIHEYPGIYPDEKSIKWTLRGNKRYYVSVGYILFEHPTILGDKIFDWCFCNATGALIELSPPPPKPSLTFNPTSTFDPNVPTHLFLTIENYNSLNNLTVIVAVDSSFIKAWEVTGLIEEGKSEVYTYDFNNIEMWCNSSTLCTRDSNVIRFSAFGTKTLNDFGWSYISVECIGYTKDGEKLVWANL